MKPSECDCVNCGLADCVYVPWFCPTGADVLLVAQAPGSTEAVVGRPLVGPAGKTEWRLCKEAGLNKESMAQTNVCACAPPADRKPTPQEIECCFPRLKAEVLLVKPRLIVALGDIAVSALTGVRRPMKSTRGQFFPLLDKYEHQCMVLCCLHPSFVMRQRQWLDIAVQDHKLITSPTPTIEEVRSEVTHIKNPTPSMLANYLQQAREHEVAFDIETPGELNPRRAEIIGIAFAYKPNEAVGMDLVKGDERWQIVKRYLEDKEAQKTTQNGSFDLECLFTNGIEVQSMTYDTRLAEHVLASDTPTDLDFLRGKYTNIPPYKPTKRDMREIGKWPSERRITYNNLDALTTWLVAQKQQALMDADDWNVLLNIEMPLIPVINYMERKGVLVDVDKLASMYAAIDPLLEELDNKHFKPLGLNPRSPTALAKHFGINSTNEKDLEYHINRDHPQAELMQAVLDYREWHNLSTKYLFGVYARLENERIHTHFLSEGTGTGRLSSRNPNLQNVPKHMRVIYIADPGCKIIEGDYKQLEFVTWAVIAPEPNLLADLMKGIDVHDMLCRTIFGKSKSELEEKQVLREKAVVFGTMGGRTARSIAIEFGVPISTAEKWQANVIAKYPGFARYLTRQTELFNNVGVVKTPFGRKRTLQTVTQAFNTPFQSSAADITKTTLAELYNKGFDLRLTVHDSIVVEAPTKHAREVAFDMKAIMERPIKQLNNHSFKAKMGVGDNWYELKEVM